MGYQVHQGATAYGPEHASLDEALRWGRKNVKGFYTVRQVGVEACPRCGGEYGSAWHLVKCRPTGRWPAVKS